MAGLTIKRAKDFYRFVRSVESFTDGQVGVVTWDVEEFKSVRLQVKPNDGPYKGGTFIFSVGVPESFPVHRPWVVCETMIYHPNIDPLMCTDLEDGDDNVCLSLLDEWESNFGLEDLVQGLLFLFYYPNQSDPLSPMFSPGDSDEEVEEKIRLSLLGGEVDGYEFPRNLDDKYKDEVIGAMEERKKKVEAQKAAEVAKNVELQLEKLSLENAAQEGSQSETTGESGSTEATPGAAAGQQSVLDAGQDEKCVTQDSRTDNSTTASVAATSTVVATVDDIVTETLANAVAAVATMATVVRLETQTVEATTVGLADAVEAVSAVVDTTGANSMIDKTKENATNIDVVEPETDLITTVKGDTGFAPDVTEMTTAVENDNNTVDKVSNEEAGENPEDNLTVDNEVDETTVKVDQATVDDSQTTPNEKTACDTYVESECNEKVENVNAEDESNIARYDELLNKLELLPSPPANDHDGDECDCDNSDLPPPPPPPELSDLYLPLLDGELPPPPPLPPPSDSPNLLSVPDLPTPPCTPPSGTLTPPDVHPLANSSAADETQLFLPPMDMPQPPPLLRSASTSHEPSFSLDVSYTGTSYWGTFSRSPLETSQLATPAALTMTSAEFGQIQARSRSMSLPGSLTLNMNLAENNGTDEDPEVTPFGVADVLAMIADIPLPPDVIEDALMPPEDPPPPPIVHEATGSSAGIAPPPPPTEPTTPPAPPQVFTVPQKDLPTVKSEPLQKVEDMLASMDSVLEKLEAEAKKEEEANAEKGSPEKEDEDDEDETKEAEASGGSVEEIIVTEVGSSVSVTESATQTLELSLDNIKPGTSESSTQTPTPYKLTDMAGPSFHIGDDVRGAEGGAMLNTCICDCDHVECHTATKTICLDKEGLSLNALLDPNMNMVSVTRNGANFCRFHSLIETTATMSINHNMHPTNNRPSKIEPEIQTMKTCTFVAPDYDCVLNTLTTLCWSVVQRLLR